MSKTNFVDGDPSQGILGTVVTSDFLNGLNNHHHTGLDQDGQGALPYAADMGTANAYVANLSPALSTYVIGMPIYFKAENTSTGACTININNLGVKSIKKNLIEDLELGDIIAGDIVVIVFDGTNFQLIQIPQRDKLVASDMVHDFVVSGLLGTDPGASLTMTIPDGIAYVMGRRVVKLDGTSDLTRTYTTNKDTYVDISHSGSITYTEVTNGAGAPAVAGNSLRLMKVVTDVSNITGVTDLRVLAGGVKDSAGTIRTLPALGAARKLLRVNDAGTDQEYFSLLRQSVMGYNTSQISNISGQTVIKSIAIDDVTIGDLILIKGECKIVKGATAGMTTISVYKSAGTCTLQTDTYNTLLRLADETVSANAAICRTGFQAWLVTGTGSCTFDLVAVSAGSTSTVYTGDGRLMICVLRGIN